MKKIVLCDIDSTLADTRHRSHLSPHADPEATWESYAQACADDLVIAGTAGLLRLLAELGVEVYYVSGRGISVIEQTIQWMMANNLPYGHVKHHDSASGDPHDHVEYKRQYLHRIQSEGCDVVLGLDDWPGVIDMYLDEGVPAICVNPMYTDDAMAFFIKKGYVPR